MAIIWEPCLASPSVDRPDLYGRQHNRMRTQALIIGAGPAGCAAAYFLARQGVEVLLADQYTFPRDKACGDGVSPAGIRLLVRMGVLDPARLTAGERRLVKGIRVVAPSGASVDLHYPWLSAQKGLDQGCVIPRRELDAMLVQRAVAVGATFLPGFRATEPVWEAGRVAGMQGACDGRAMELRADIIIVATGCRLRLLRALGLCESAPPSTIGVRGYLALQTSAFPEPYIHIHVQPTLLPDYAWIFPVNDQLVNVGVACARGWRQPDKDALTTLLSRFVAQNSGAAHRLAGAVPVGPPMGAPLRADFLRRRTYAAGILVAGEAAGLVDPLTGEGIAFALQSGELAAQVAFRALATGDFDRGLAAYDRALKHRFASYFRFARQLRARLRDPHVAEALVSMAAQLKRARAHGWVSSPAARLAQYVLGSLPVLGCTPYLAYRLMAIRSRRIEL